MGGACGAPRLLSIYLISKMHTKTIQKIQKAYIKTYEDDVNIYKDIENYQGQGAFFLKTPVAPISKPRMLPQAFGLWGLLGGPTHPRAAWNERPRCRGDVESRVTSSF